jgi:hypothetical protein
MPQPSRAMSIGRREEYDLHVGGLMSFFSHIRGYFDGRFSGRYIACLMQVVSQEDGRPFWDYFSNRFRKRFAGLTFKPGALELIVEHRFRIHGRNRSADLALSLHGEVIALVELKFDDSFHGKQLQDYLEYCNKNHLEFIVITRGPLADEEYQRLRPEQHAHYVSFVTHLAESEHFATKSLYEYFREEGFVLETINLKSLYLFAHRLLKQWNFSGRIHSDARIMDGPKQFSSLLANVKIIAAEIAPWLRHKSAKRHRAATIDFKVNPRVDASKAAGSLEAEKGYVQPRFRRGGEMYVLARSAASVDGRWLYFHYGIIENYLTA